MIFSISSTATVLLSVLLDQSVGNNILYFRHTQKKKSQTKRRYIFYYQEWCLYLTATRVVSIFHLSYPSR